MSGIISNVSKGGGGGGGGGSGLPLPWTATLDGNDLRISGPDVTGSPNGASIALEAQGGDPDSGVGGNVSAFVGSGYTADVGDGYGMRIQYGEYVLGTGPADEWCRLRKLDYEDGAPVLEWRANEYHSIRLRAGAAGRVALRSGDGGAYGSELAGSLDFVVGQNVQIGDVVEGNGFFDLGVSDGAGGHKVHARTFVGSMYDTTSASPANVIGILVPQHTAVVVTSRSFPMKSDSSEAGYVARQSVFRRVTGSVVQVGSTEPVSASGHESGYNVTHTGSSGYVVVSAVGKASTTVKWRHQVQVDFFEIGS